MVTASPGGKATCQATPTRVSAIRSHHQTSTTATELAMVILLLLWAAGLTTGGMATFAAYLDRLAR